MARAFFEALEQAGLVEIIGRLQATTVDLAERVNRTSTTAARPPSSHGRGKALPKRTG